MVRVILMKHINMNNYYRIIVLISYLTFHSFPSLISCRSWWDPRWVVEKDHLVLKWQVYYWSPGHTTRPRPANRRRSSFEERSLRQRNNPWAQYPQRPGTWYSRPGLSFDPGTSGRNDLIKILAKSEEISNFFVILMVVHRILCSPEHIRR